MFRFTIRELVLLTLVVAMGVAWWLDQTRLQAVVKEHDESSIEAWQTVGGRPTLFEDRLTQELLDYFDVVPRRRFPTST